LSLSPSHRTSIGSVSATGECIGSRWSSTGASAWQHAYLGVSAADHLGDVIHEVTHTLKPELAKRKTEMPVVPPGSRYASININSVFGGQPEEGTQTPCVVDRVAPSSTAGSFRGAPRRRAGRDPGATGRAGRKKFGRKYSIEDLMVVLPTQTDPESLLVNTVRPASKRFWGSSLP